MSWRQDRSRARGTGLALIAKGAPGVLGYHAPVRFEGSWGDRAAQLRHYGIHPGQRLITVAGTQSGHKYMRPVKYTGQNTSAYWLSVRNRLRSTENYDANAVLGCAAAYSSTFSSCSFRSGARAGVIALVRIIRVVRYVNWYSGKRNSTRKYR
jgi:hypothetical protein